jgi:hypothetical protein
MKDVSGIRGARQGDRVEVGEITMNLIFDKGVLSMQAGAWIKEFPAAITVCDAGGVILEMNDRASETFAKDGGRDLVGQGVLDCHPEPARSKLLRILEEGSTNCYTTEKDGVKKLIFQTPWYEGGQYMGLVELAIQLPKDVPNFIR